MSTPRAAYVAKMRRYRHARRDRQRIIRLRRWFAERNTVAALEH